MINSTIMAVARWAQQKHWAQKSLRCAEDMEKKDQGYGIAKVHQMILQNIVVYAEEKETVDYWMQSFIMSRSSVALFEAFVLLDTWSLVLHGDQYPFFYFPENIMHDLLDWWRAGFCSLPALVEDSISSPPPPIRQIISIS